MGHRLRPSPELIRLAGAESRTIVTCEIRQVRKEATVAGLLCATGCSALFSSALCRGDFLSQYEVIARKWRPQSFKNLVGQNHVAQTLLNALKSERIPHALLFTGPRGTGKTSSARILAKSLRCTNSKDFVPCGECDDCRDIARGRHIDVIEIDGASNNGVDSVRELRDSVSYLPSTGFYKIYIIDEVHMLSTSAFNALLKTLEEPPEHVIFIMATTEVQKLPNTILSRCQRFDFKTIPQKEIQEHLEKICKEEKVKYSPEALWLIAKQAKGSMRDSQSLLDQIITFCDKNITLDQVTEILGLSARELINESLQAITQQNTAALPPILVRLSQTGSDPALFIEDLLEQLRNALMVKIKAHKDKMPLNLPDSEIQFLDELTRELSEEDIHLLFDITLKGSLNLSRTTDPRLALEMLLLKLAAAPRVQSLAQWSQGQQPLSVNVKKNFPQQAPPVNKIPPPQTAPEPKKTVEAPINLSNDPWHVFVEKVRESNGLLAALLEHTFIVDRNKEQLTLGLPEKMSFLLDKLKDPKNLDRLKAFLKTYWQEDLSVQVELCKEKKPDPVTPKQKVTKVKEDEQKIEKQKIEEHPLMKRTQNLFKTEIVSIREEKTHERT